MPNYDGPLYAPYDVMLMGKLTRKQWQQVYNIVVNEQKGLLAMFDEDRHNELTDILEKLYPLAYTK